MSSFEVESKFMVSAIMIDGSRGYYALDGGYPFWSSSPLNAVTWKNISDVATESDSYSANRVVSREVLRLDTIATVVAKEDVVSAAKVKAMKEVAEIEKRLQEKLAELENLS